MKSSSSAAKVLIFNASLGGEAGNTAGAIAALIARFPKDVETRTVVLADVPGPDRIQESITWAEGLVVATGTHWDGWSSHLQRLLEDWTHAEGTGLWLGKPAAVVVTEHSTGGKGVLSRLQGVLCTLGCSIPPMSGIVLGKATQIAAAYDARGSEDFWSTEDLSTVAHNLIVAIRGGRDWRAWPVERENVSARWWR